MIPGKTILKKAGGELLENILPTVTSTPTKKALTQAVDTGITSVDDVAKNVGTGNLKAISDTANQVQASRNISKRNNQIQGVINPTVEKTPWEKAKADVQGTGDKMRRAAAFFFGGEGGPKTYANSGLYGATKRTGPAITNLHHAGFLEKLKRAFVGHRSFDTLQEGQTSPIIQGLEARGIKLGNWFENMADVTSVITNAGRTAKKEALWKQSGIDKDTINDLLGGYGPVRKDVAFAEHPIKKVGTKIDGEEIDPDLETMGDTIIESIKTNQPRKGFKKYTIKYPDGTIEKWQPQTQEEFQKRFIIVTDKYRQRGFEVKKPSLKDAKIDSNLEIYGGDHDIVHEITDAMEGIPGTAINAIKVASDNGTIRDMPVDQLVDLQFQQLVEMETVLGNVLKKRYTKIQQIFRKAQKGGQYPKVDFDDLPAELKQRFFMQNINEIAVAGGIHEPIVNQKTALKPITDWNEGLTEVFGWKPQTLNQPPRAEVEAVSKAIRGKSN